MPRPVALISPLFVFSFCALGCSRKPLEEGISLRSTDFSTPVSGAASAEAPEFVRSLSLLYPRAGVFRVDNRIVQKTNHSLADVVAYYHSTFVKHGFSESTRLDQLTGALLQYDRLAKDKTERISVDIQKLPYEESYLIRLARSEVERIHGKTE